MQMNEMFQRESLEQAKQSSRNGSLVHWRPNESLPEAEQYAMVMVEREGFDIK